MKINCQKRETSALFKYFGLMLLFFMLFNLVTTESYAQRVKKAMEELEELSCDEYAQARGFVWAGKDPKMTFQELASYCAPIIWFSPDEPLLDHKSGLDVRLPEPFPFEDDPGAPIVYYRVDQILERDDAEGGIRYRTRGRRLVS